MCNWKKWIWPGILTTVLLSALALQMKSGLIEQDLQSKAISGLAQDHQWASVELDGRDLTLSGAAPSEEAISGALQLADSAYDVRVAESAATLLPIAEPFILSVVKGDNKLILDGNVPNDQVRKSVTEAAAAAFSGAELVDNLTLARGAPDGFGDLAGFGISQLTGLETGTARITGPELSVEGVARDKAAFDAVREALSGSLPGGGKLAMQEIIAPMVSPYTFSATKGDTGVVLEGFVPNEEARTVLVSAASATNSGAVTDNLEQGSGAIDGFGDLASFATSQLSRFSNGTVSLSNNKLSVKGTALSPQAYDEAVAALAGPIPSGGEVTVSDLSRSTVSPYTFSAMKETGAIILDGYVDSREAKQAAIDAATEQNPGDRVVDRLTIANGVPDGLNWQEAIRVAVVEASQFSKGTGSLNNGQYSLDGMAKSAEAYQSLVTGMALPAGLTAGERDIRRPLISPYVWSFENSEGSAPTLSGYVPEEGDAAANIAQIEARLGTASAVSNGLEIGAGAPVNLKGATSVAIQTVSRLVNGKAAISGTDLMVSGEALSEIAAAEIRSQIENGVPPGFAGKHEISVRKASDLPQVAADECQTLLTDELAHNSIKFETNKSLIQETSYGLLDRLSFYVKRCPTANVEISGHTDADGSDDYNQVLSEDRANAVRSYLVRSGVFVGRLAASGYGETSPIGDNGTDEGKAMNRRIEFTVTR